MDTSLLFMALQGNRDKNDPRHIVLELRTRKGLFRKVLDRVGADDDVIYLCGGDISDLPEEGSEERVRVQPLPTSPHVGPNGEIYPIG